MCLHPSVDSIYKCPTKRAEFLRQRKKLFSLSLRLAKPLISRESLITKRVSPVLSRSSFSRFNVSSLFGSSCC